MGKFDHTSEGKGFRPKNVRGKNRGYFDLPYFEVLASSRFTLCPGGDAPWSERFYEAAAMSSMPVINNVRSDYSPPENHTWLHEIDYAYMTMAELHDNSQPEEKKLSSNRRKFLRYQTF